MFIYLNKFDVIYRMILIMILRIAFTHLLSVYAVHLPSLYAVNKVHKHNSTITDYLYSNYRLMSELNDLILWFCPLVFPVDAFRQKVTFGIVRRCC